MVPGARRLGRTASSSTPGAWSHYSYAIHDALELARGPVVEVHLSDIESREEWRRHSVLEDIAAHRVIGKGPEGYKEALEFLTRDVDRLRARCSRSRCSSLLRPTSAT